MIARGALSVLVLSLLPSVALARADVIVNLSGGGMTDDTPVEPVGGNAGTTLAAQRRLALEYAAHLWGERLDSAVPITIDVVFEPLPCSGATSVLGAAAAVAVFTGISKNGANPEYFYASALANRLAGEDLDPAEPEISMQLNSDLDGPCLRGSGGFYYGFDRQRGTAIDFVETVLHELAHGLGLSSFADPESGSLMMGSAIDPFTALVRDLDFDETWPALSDEQRRASSGHVRRVVWDGARAKASVADQYARGVPSLVLEPAVAAFSGMVADTSFAQNSALVPASGALVAGGDELCDDALDPAAVSGAVLLLQAQRCPFTQALAAAVAAGAAGVLIPVSSPFDSPALPFDFEAESIELPAQSVSKPDAQRIAQALAAGPLHAALAGQATQPLGADSQQRPLLFASNPVSATSSISHLDPLVRPQQLMEPITGPLPTHELGFTLAMLSDLGWQLSCGNGRLDSGEACDDGAANSDMLPDRCRSDCKAPRCGDGVRDRGEACDDEGGACSSDCAAGGCGDGVVDPAEQCDDGARNSDSAPDACRGDCTRARCGDGVRDSREACDDGARNAAAGACRKDCRSARCGDGVVDAGEACDDGARNSDTEPGRCREDCQAAHCGDGVVDPGESCDDGARNSDDAAGACRSDCTAARCGDGVVDPGELCDGTPDCEDCGRTARSSQDRAPGFEPSITPDEEPPSTHDAGVSPQRADAGCSCRTGGPRGAAPHEHEGAWFALGLALVLSRRRRRKS